MRQESEQWKAQMEVNMAQRDFNRATIDAMNGQTKATYALCAWQVGIVLMLAFWRWRCARVLRSLTDEIERQTGRTRS